MSASTDGFLHLMKQASQQQQQDSAPFVYGHIANYDPKTNRVRLILPSVRDEDGNPVLTPWMQLGSSFAGNGYGIQVAPMGGATLKEPTKGEQCLVARIDRAQGFGAVLLMGFNQVNVPPVADLQPGEVVLAANGGSFVRFHADKQIEVNSQDKVVVTAVGNVEVTTQGDAKVTASGKATITAPHCEIGNGGTLQPVKLADDSASTVLKAE